MFKSSNLSKKDLLWSPTTKQLNESEINKFSQKLIKNKIFNCKKKFKSLWKWSVNSPNEFWSSVWDFSKIIGKKENKILKKNKIFNKNIFFHNSKLNYAKNLLVKRNDEIAINFLSENLIEKKITWNELYNQVCKFSYFLKKIKLKKGDRVAAYVPNSIESIITFLGTAKNGSVWSSCSPDFGIQGVVDRFLQIKPKILITSDIYYYNGKKINILQKIPEILKKINTIDKVIVFPYDIKFDDDPNNIHKSYLSYNKIIKDSILDENFEEFNFNHPLYILYSSGTTGYPKCIAHGAGNVLIEHKKEYLLHCNIKNSEKVFFYTTTGWMMWNWLIGTLSCGATVCLYDGSPSYPSIDTLIKYCSKHEFNFFGVSAKYIDFLKKNNFNANKYNLKKLKTIASTGSPLVKESFQYVYKNIKKNVHLSSISGGTDLVGCLVLGNFFSKVYAGEIQGESLGIDIDIFDNRGMPTKRGVKGELVVKKPFPSMPIKFWNDSGGKKYKNAYFNKFFNVWHHGDYIEKTKRDGYIIHGRSDTTLNPGGVRIGTSEIYRQVEAFSDVTEALVVGQRWKNDIRIILFLTTKKNQILNKKEIDEIKLKIRRNCSPKHVPAKVICVKEIPRTKSGKIVEIAVKKIIHNEKIENIEAIANPNSLNYFKNIHELKV